MLAKLLPERHNLYGNSLDFKLNIYKKKMVESCNSCLWAVLFQKGLATNEKKGIAARIAKQFHLNVCEERTWWMG